MNQLITIFALFVASMALTSAWNVNEVGASNSQFMPTAPPRPFSELHPAAVVSTSDFQGIRFAQAQAAPAAPLPQPAAPGIPPSMAVEPIIEDPAVASSVGAAGPSGELDDESKKLVAALSEVNNLIFVKGTELKRENDWVTSVEKLIETYREKRSKVMKHCQGLIDEIKTLRDKQNKIKSQIVHQRLKRQISVANDDLSTLESALAQIRQKEDKIKGSRDSIKGSIESLLEQMKNLSGEAKQCKGKEKCEKKDD